MKDKYDALNSLMEIETFINAIKSTSYRIFTEGNSMKQLKESIRVSAGKFRMVGRYVPSLADRNEVRKQAFRIQTEIDQMQQHLDELSRAISDLEACEDLEFSDHGEKVEGF